MRGCERKIETSENGREDDTPVVVSKRREEAAEEALVLEQGVTKGRMFLTAQFNIAVAMDGHLFFRDRKYFRCCMSR